MQVLVHPTEKLLPPELYLQIINFYAIVSQVEEYLF